MMCLLFELRDYKLKLESLIVFPLQNRGGNQYQNHGDRIENGRLILKGW